MWELRIDTHIPKNLNIEKEKKIKEKKICGNLGCSNNIKARGTRAKYCSLKCSIEDKKKWKIRICKNCNIEYQSTRYRKSFCSTKCYREDVKVERRCQNSECNSVIKKSVKKSKYCSKNCYKYIRSKHIVRITHCQFNGCGEKLSETKMKYFQKYCGSNCYQKDRKIKNESSIGEKISLRKRKEWEYPRRFIKTQNGWIMVARHTWEKVNGSIPPKHYIAYKDGDSFNDQDIDNLYIKNSEENIKGRKS